MKSASTLFLVFFISISTFSYSQNEVLRFKINTKNTRSKKTTYSLVNSKTNDLAFLVTDRKQIHANLFDADFQVISQFSFEATKRKFLDPLAYSINDGIYNLLYATRNFSKLIVISINFNTKTTKTKELDFEIGKELYIDTIVHNNEMFMLTSDKTSIIIRTLSNDKNLETVKSFKVSENSKNDILYESNPDYWGYFWLQIAESNITKIDHRIPISIEQASTPNKLYKFNDQLIISLEDEEEDKGTLVYTFDLNTFDFVFSESMHWYCYDKEPSQGCVEKISSVLRVDANVHGQRNVIQSHSNGLDSNSSSKMAANLTYC